MKLNIKRYHYGVLATIGMGMCLLATPVSAKVTGQCAICHTMHNSQGGAPMALKADGLTAETVPNDVLLLRGCVACHTGTNTGSNVIPYVTDTGPPNYRATGTEADSNTLAGGSFYWVANNVAGNNDAAASSTGHNVATDTMASADPLGNMPPGATNSLTAQLRCAGVNGCHGDTDALTDFLAIKGTHHADDTVINGDTVATSFRFLDGIVGLEDDAWEYQPTSTAHNQYKGIDRSDASETDTTLMDTISSLCARCHNDFHNGSGNVGGTNPSGGTFASPWVRHPTDFDMGNTDVNSEYRAYGGGTYVVSAPVASSTIDTISGIVETTIDFNGDAIVTCISCHRAHGSPNADLLRWDYSLVEAGGAVGGACFECHTTKR